jgi:translation initiation factor 1
MKKSNFTSGGTVYSTEHGRMCPDCGRPVAECLCRQQKTALPKGDGVARVSLETKGRKGKGVTLITGLPMAEEGLSALAKRLKQHCGSGGTVKDGVIEIQGDHRQTVAEALETEGYRVKRVGGGW